MSSYTLEGILYSIQANPDFRARYLADPQKTAAEYPLTMAERADLLSWNVQAMSRHGVSDMLLMVAFTMINGQEAMPDYMRRMNAPAMQEKAA